MALQSALFASEVALIHLLGGRVPIPYLAGVRGAAGIMIAYLFARSLRALFTTNNLGIQLLRGLAGLIYAWVQVYSFTTLPLADATAISYTQAFYITLFSVLLLGEQVGRWRWFATGMAIVGALLIAKPSFGGSWSWAYLIALVGTAFNGLTVPLTRYLVRNKDREWTCVAYINVVIVAGNVPLIFFVQPPALETGSWLLLYLFLGPIGMYAGTVAAKYADANFLAPYTLLRLLISVMIAMLFFGEFPDPLKWLGMLLILMGCWLPTGRRTASTAATSRS